jgi:hypothetical protein
MDRSREGASLACHNFSDVRRRPLVIGKLDQVRLPFVVTMPQLLVGSLTLGGLILTRSMWGTIMSDRLHIVVLAVVPVLVAQQVTRTSFEGRPLSKAALGLVRLWTAPANGEINGHRVGGSRRHRLVARPLVAPTPTHHRTGRRGRRAAAGRAGAGRRGRRG